MNLKQLFLLIITLANVNLSQAQIGFGPEIGAGIATMKFAPRLDPVTYTSASVNPIFGGKIGGVVDFPLNRQIYFQAGISLSREGAVRAFSYYHNDSFNEAVNQTLYINYANLPLTVLYKSGMQGKGRFIAGVGATLSYIIGGQNKLQDHQVFNDTPSNTNGTYKISGSNTVAGLNVGVNLCAGYELSTGLFFRAYYNVGVKDLGLGTEIDKTRSLGVSAGYFFGKGRDINKEKDDLIDHSTE
jgi:outer membrane protein with beta-barrel domain